jgi:uncharacterized protein YqjF (DUF2071 family)
LTQGIDVLGEDIRLLHADGVITSGANRGMPEASAGTPAARAFLTAEWRDVVMVNYAVDPARLRPHVPRGTELDSHDGRTCVTLVGFRFLDTRVFGVAWPFHRNFDEVNLRFYVRREVEGEARRGVVFVREIVPRAAIAAIAWARYNEPYLARRMRSEVWRGAPSETSHLSYEWKDAGRWSRLDLTVSGEPTTPGAGSEAQFISEHYWGYTRQRDGSTIEYRVAHAPWRVWTDATVDLTGDVGGVFGEEFAAVLHNVPLSAFVAEGSSVIVHYPTPLDA